MARKSYEGTGNLPGLEDPAPARAAQSRAVPKDRAPRRPAVPAPRVIRGTVWAAVILIGALYSFHKIERFLIDDGRFSLNGPDGSDGAASLQISGATHASRRAIEAVFSGDFGQSVYLIPLSDRRTTLRTVDWVKDASLARLWPNRVVVRIAERKPVAFVALASGRPALIDEDGVILPPAKDHFDLPVLSGVRLSDPLSDRRERVRRLLSVLKDLGDAGKKISEIDVSDRDNIRVSQPYGGRIFTLMLGDRDFGLRYRNFANHIAEIQQKLPGAATLDMRLEDRITVVP